MAEFSVGGVSSSPGIPAPGPYTPPQGSALSATQAVDLLGGLARNQMLMQELRGRNAIGNAYKQSIQPDGTFDQPGFNALIAGNPDAAWLAGEHLPKGLEIARQQSGNMLQQSQAAMSLWGSLPPNATDEQIRNVQATAARIFKGQNSAILTAIGNDLLSKRGKERAAAIADLTGLARGPEAQSARVQAGFGPGGEPLVSSSGAVTRAEQTGGGATAGGLPASQPEDLRQMQADQARQANFRNEMIPYEEAIKASNELHARNPGQPIFGPGSQQRQLGQSYLYGLAPGVLQDLGIDPKDLSDYDKVKKYATQAIQTRAAGLGVHSDQGLTTTISGNPNVGINDLAFDDLIRMNAALRRAEYAQHQNSAERAGPTGFGYPRNKSSWPAQNDVRAFMLPDLSPEQRAKLVGSMKKGSPEWTRFNHSVHEGVKSGVIDLPPAPAKPGKQSSAEPPIPGARMAADGQWYVRQPHDAGDYQRVVMQG